MNTKSNTDLQTRLLNWIDQEQAIYQIGVCFGFWSEFGAPYDFDKFNGMKNNISGQIGSSILILLESFVEQKILEKHIDEIVYYRWNKGFQIKDNFID